MGQLIKLQDYISRYETDVYRYAGEFIRLKKKQWERIKEQWESGEADVYAPSDFSWEWLEENRSLFQTVKGWFKRSKEKNGEKESANVLHNEDTKTAFFHPCL